MRRLTVVLDHQINGRPVREMPFEEVQAMVNRAVPAARWAWFGYVGNRFCLDTVVSEQRRQEALRQAGQAPFIVRVKDEPWP